MNEDIAGLSKIKILPPLGNTWPKGITVVAEILEADLFLVLKKSHHRLRVFQAKGRVCVNCGLEGNKMYILYRQSGKSYHMELYHESPGLKLLMTVDHIIPVSRGGSNGINNLQPMCEPCNLKKGSKMPIEWGMEVNPEEYACVGAA